MQVFIDGRMLYKSGIGRYIRNILQETMLLDADLKYLLAGCQKEITYFAGLSKLNEQRLETVKYEHGIYTVSEQIYGSLLALKYSACDVFFFPHYNVPCLCPSNSVVTVHDIIHFKLEKLYNRARVLAASQVLKNGVFKAEKIIAISESTKNDLQEMFPLLPSSKIEVIYQGVDSHFKPASAAEINNLKQRLGLEQYILYVGNRLKHKNLDRLIGAYIDLIGEVPDLQLVICGQRFSHNDEIDELKQKFKLSGVVEMDSLHDEELATLYSGAEALVFPSLYEGFGLPPLEAMACHTPVIVAKTSSLPEVVGDAGIYFNPYDIEEMGAQIYNVLNDSHLRECLKTRGIEQAQKFSWTKTASETLEVFRKVSQHN